MTTQEFRQYFEDIASANTEINTFQYGGLQRILTRNPSVAIAYPLLFLEKPTYSFVGENSSLMAAPRAAFVILKNAEDWGSIEAQDEAEDETFQIAIDIISKLIKDYREKTIQLFSPNGLTIAPIDTITLDGDIGWRVEFSLNTQIDFCYNPLKWNE